MKLVHKYPKLNYKNRIQTSSLKHNQKLKPQLLTYILNIFFILKIFHFEKSIETMKILGIETSNFYTRLRDLFVLNNNQYMKI